MLQIAFFCLIVGQVPPPPVPHAPESNGKSSPADKSRPADDPQAQRKWLLSHITADLQAQGQLDAAKYHDVEQMVNNVRDSQLGKVIQHYQQRKAQVEAEAKANLRRLQAYRDALKRELQWRIAVSRQEQALTPSASAPAAVAQSGQFAMQDFYPAQAWPDYAQSYTPYTVYRPYYYAPHPHLEAGNVTAAGPAVYPPYHSAPNVHHLHHR
jgi:hypothetical protein